MPHSTSTMYHPVHEAETVAGNTDLLILILLRLPAKSLLRFKSVSKQWRSLISSTSFTDLHQINTDHTASGVILHFPSKPSLDFAFLAGKSRRRSNLPPPLTTSVRVLQSCNGLLLCSVRRGPHSRTLHVYNPTTGDLSSPPEPPISATWTNLVFDPAESPHHQLISVVQNSSSKIHRYSSATGNWTPCEIPNFKAPFALVLSGGVYWRGSLHWLAPNSTDRDSFFLDVEQARSGPILIPPVSGRRRRQSSLECSGGRLLLVEAYEGGEIRVSEMKEGFSGWEVMYEIGAIDGFPEVFGRVCNGLKVDCRFQVCCVVEMVVVVRLPGKVLGFDLESGRSWEMREVLPRSSQSASEFEWVHVFPYVESLASV